MNKYNEYLELFEIKDGKVFYDGEEKKIGHNSQGYPRVTIDKMRIKVHKLVALKYIPNPENKDVIDHIDDDKNNFDPSNLKWTTQLENLKKAYDTNPNKKNMHNRAKNKLRKIASEKDGVITIHDSLRKCGTFLGRNCAAVWRALQGEWNLCAGHKLWYLDVSEIKDDYIINPDKSYKDE